MFYSDSKIAHFVTVRKANIIPKIKNDEYLGYFIFHMGSHENFTALWKQLNFICDFFKQADERKEKEYWLVNLAYEFWNAIPLLSGSACVGGMFVDVLCRAHYLEFPQDETSLLRGYMAALFGGNVNAFLQRTRPTYLSQCYQPFSNKLRARTKVIESRTEIEKILLLFMQLKAN